jgi:hypothetical protein
MNQRSPKMGLLKLVRNEDGTYRTIQSFIHTGSEIIPNPAEDVLETVFENGVITSSETFDAIKARVSADTTIIRKMK